MAQAGYSYRSAAIQTVQDNVTSQPSGTTVVQSTPSVAAAIAQTSRNSTTAPYYTKTSSSILVLTMDTTPGFTTGSKIAVFWTGSDGKANWCSDCTITSIVGDVVTITAPLATLSAVALAAGQLYFNGATTTGAGDVAGKKITAGTTVVTFSLATIATADLPNNPDVTDVTIAQASVEQLVLCCPGGTGGFELIDSAGTTLLLAWNYSTAGEFFDSADPTAPTWTGTADTLRFYNSTMTALLMKLGAVLA